MKLMVFSENNGMRKYVEDLLTSTPHHFKAFELKTLLNRDGRTESFDGMLVDYDSWQRCASILKYFGVLENINTKPIVVISKFKKMPPLKFRNRKAVTSHCSFPSQTEEFYSAIQQMSGALATA